MKSLNSYLLIIFLLMPQLVLSEPQAGSSQTPQVNDSTSDEGPMVADYAGDYIAARDERVLQGGANITQQVGDGVEAAKNAAGKARDALGKGGEAMARGINNIQEKGVGKWTSETVSAGVEGTKKRVGDAVKAVDKKVSAAASRGVEAMGNAVNSTADTLGRGGKAVADEINAVRDKGAREWAGEKVENTRKAVGEAKKNAQRTARRKVEGAVDAVKDAPGKALGKVRDGLGNAAQSTADSINYAKGESDKLGKLQKDVTDAKTARNRVLREGKPKSSTEYLDASRKVRRAEGDVRRQKSKMLGEGATAVGEKVKFTGRKTAEMVGHLDTAADVAGGYKKEAEAAAKEDRDISYTNVAKESFKNLSGLSAGDRGMEIGKEESLKLEREGKRGLNMETAGAMAKGGSRAVGEMFWSGGKNMSQKIIEEEMVEEIKQAEKEGREVDTSAAKARAAVRVTGEMTGMNTIFEAGMTDYDAERQANRTSRKLQEKAEDKLATQIGSAMNLQERIEELSKSNNPADKARLEEAKNKYQGVIDQIKTEQQRLDDKGLVDKNDPGLVYLRGKAQELPSTADAVQDIATYEQNHEKKVSPAALESNKPPVEIEETRIVDVKPTPTEIADNVEEIEDNLQDRVESVKPERTEVAEGIGRSEPLIDSEVSAGSPEPTYERVEIDPQTLIDDKYAGRTDGLAGRSGRQPVAEIEPYDNIERVPDRPSSLSERVRRAARDKAAAQARALARSRKPAERSTDSLPNIERVPRSNPDTSNNYDDSDLFDDFDGESGSNDLATVRSSVNNAAARSQSSINRAASRGSLASSRSNQAISFGQTQSSAASSRITGEVIRTSSERHRGVVVQKEEERRQARAAEERRQRAARQAQAQREERARQAEARRQQQRADAERRRQDRVNRQRAQAQERQRQADEARRRAAAGRNSGQRPPSNSGTTSHTSPRGGSDLGTVGTGGSFGSGDGCIYGVITIDGEDCTGN